MKQTVVLFLLLLFVGMANAQMVTGVWRGSITKGKGLMAKSMKVELKLVKKADSLLGSCYYYVSPKTYMQYTVRGYFDAVNNAVHWQDEKFIDAKPERSAGDGGSSQPMKSTADFNCPNPNATMKLDGFSEIGEGELFETHLTKVPNTLFPDEWDNIIKGYTVGMADPEVIDSVWAVASTPKFDPLAKEKAAAEEKVRQETIAKEKAAADEKAKEAAIAREKAKAEEKAQKEAIAREKAAVEEQARQEKLAKERAIAEEKAKQEAIAREKIAAEERARQETIAREKAIEEEKLRQETIAKEKAAAEEKARQDAIAREKAAVEEKARQETLAREKAAADEKAKQDAIKARAKAMEEKAKQDAIAKAAAEEKARDAARARARAAEEKTRAAATGAVAGTVAAGSGSKPNTAAVTSTALPEKQDPEAVKRFTTRKKVQQGELPMQGDSVELHFYDNAEVDGDSISLFVNGRLLFTHVRLSTQPFIFKLGVKDLPETSEMAMVAENLGAIPPNTALMLAFVNGERLSFRLESTEQSSGTIKLVRRE